MYRLTDTDVVVRIADGAEIPADPANADRATYTRWLLEGNEPQPALAASAEQLDAQARSDADPFIEKGIAALNGLGLDIVLTGLPAPIIAAPPAEPVKAPGVLIVEARAAVIAMKTLSLEGCSSYVDRKLRYVNAWKAIANTFLPYPTLKEKFEREIR